MKKYGHLYKTSDFIGKLIPNNQANRLIHSGISFIKTLDYIQSSNNSITLSIHAADGVWCYHRGAPLFFVKPTQKHILLHVFKRNEISDAILVLDDKNLFNNLHPANYSYRVWKLGISELAWLKNHLIEKFPPSDITQMSNAVEHPRHIPGDIRQAALETFIKKGRVCHGVAGKTKKHKLHPDERIEFDHILPHSEGGSNGFYNVQVLCMACNRIKRATAE